MRIYGVNSEMATDREPWPMSCQNHIDSETGEVSLLSVIANTYSSDTLASQTGMPVRLHIYYTIYVHYVMCTKI